MPPYWTFPASSRPRLPAAATTTMPASVAALIVSFSASGETASDRGNVRVAQRFDPLSRPFLRALRQIVRAVDGKIPVTLCGELAGNALGAMALVGLGYRSLSMSAAGIGPVKAAILALDSARLRQRMDEMLDGNGPDGTLRPALTAFADAEGIPY